MTATTFKSPVPPRFIAHKPLVFHFSTTYSLGSSPRPITPPSITPHLVQLGVPPTPCLCMAEPGYAFRLSVHFLVSRVCFLMIPLWYLLGMSINILPFSHSLLSSWWSFITRREESHGSTHSTEKSSPWQRLQPPQPLPRAWSMTLRQPRPPASSPWTKVLKAIQTDSLQFLKYIWRSEHRHLMNAQYMPDSMIVVL